MINELELRKKKRERSYRIISFLGVVLFSLLIVFLLFVSQTISSKEYPLEYTVIGEKGNTVFQDSGLELVAIKYGKEGRQEFVTLYGKDSELKEVSKVAIEVDLTTLDFNAEEQSNEVVEDNESEVNRESNGDNENEEVESVAKTEDSKEGEELDYTEKEFTTTLPIRVYGYSRDVLEIDKNKEGIEVYLKVRKYKEDSEDSNSDKNNNNNKESEDNKEQDSDSDKDKDSDKE